MKTYKSKHDIEDEFVPVSDRTWFIKGELTIVYIRDYNADCDADGNRGRDVTYEDERIWKLEAAAPADGIYQTENIPAEVVKAAQEWADAYEPDEWGGREEDDCED